MRSCSNLHTSQLQAIIDPANPNFSPDLGQCDGTEAKYHIPSKSIQHLPIELLVKIFLFCLPSHIKDLRPSPETAPLLLCQICAVWRYTTLRTPQLWASLSVVLQILPDGSIDIGRHEEVAKRWFHKAAMIPLSLSIYSVPEPTPLKYFEDLGRLVLLPHANRIRELNLYFWLIGDILAFLPHDVGQTQGLPNLECLECLVIYLQNKPQLEESHPIVMFQSAPRLHKVNLLRVDPSHTLINWAQLIELCINDIKEFDLMTLLAQCTNLEHGTFYVTQSLHGAPPAVSFVLPNLARLTLVLCDNTWADCFRGSHFPALDRLSITHDIWHGYHPYTIPGYLCRQLNGIRRLTVGYISVPSMTGILSSSSSVSRFKVLWAQDDNGTLFRLLTIRNVSEDLLPNLQDLSICCSLRRTRDFYLNKFIRMLQSRGPQRPTSFPSLRRVKLDISIGDSDKALNLRKEIESAVQESFPFGAPQVIFK